MAEYYKAKQNKIYSEEIEDIDYKDVKMLQKYVNSIGNISVVSSTNCINNVNK